ncbi:hypothetical protein GHT06_009290 [Daphnia sinensis]|uniref:Tissue factor pathway inhibitor n=1 Tax=Daphnia sinensis TaxID=1820382 RepID=A0AAD5Q1D1_9CRUS|nr:hypothetical protein GHT06_009290 [Daphnia sinensis]
MLSERLILLLLLAATVMAIPRPDDSDESKDDDEDDCSLPAIIPEANRCRAFLSRWTFKNGACEQITYGGCGGTKNLFETEYACNAKCNRKALLRGPDARARELVPSPCQLPLATGHCRAHIPSFYFDSATGSCKPFTFTGCKGNANNFISMEDCQRTCKVRLSAAVTLPAPVKDTTKTVSDICTLPPDNSKSTGRACMAFVPSWTFNATTGKCESYVYGGCGKTANLFRTEEACQATCSSTARNVVQSAVRNQESCLLPIAKGPCFGFMKRYAFNKEKNRCELFTYGGCQGNGNNFATADQCFEACGGALPSLTAECEQVTCPISNKRYFERGCLPEYKGKACCPTSFSCPDDKSAKGVCHYGGNTYQLGQQVAAVSEDQPCKTNCFCVSSVEHQDGATIKCSDVECPVVDPPAKGKDGCELVTKPNTCCPSYHCHDHSSEEKEVDICLLNGQEYTKGQAIPTGDPCKTCTCVEGFTGLNGPGCRETQCLIDNRVGCVPVYTDNVCCPTSYKCAKDATTGAENTTRIIRVEGEPGKQGAVTLPFLIPGGNVRKWQVKAALCLLPKATGWCRASVPSFYYDADQLKCLPFIYGGCRGNENRFASEAECMSTCQHSDEETVVTETPGEARKATEETKKSSSPFISSGAAVTLSAVVPDVWAKPKDPSAVSLRCSMPMRIGPCRMSLEKFYYDAEKNDCLLFFYGGCKGNSNQFDTAEECRQTCGVKPKTSIAMEQPNQDIARAAKQNVCDLPQEPGPCKGQVPAFFYNAETGACESFWYGGCRGNGNRFETETECRAQCVPAASTELRKASPVASVASSETIPEHCKLPADIGPCRAAKPRYHYNVTAGECQPFNFGGCRGNDNNFHTIEQCQSECTASGPAEQPLLAVEVRARKEMREEEHIRCKLPADVGFCRAFKERFYYDSIENQCKTFSWGGCRGNANNFATAEECFATCDRQGKARAAVSDPKTPARFRVSQRFRANPVEDIALPEVDTKENEHVEIVPKRDQLVCTFGNETLNLGDRLQPEDPCEECVCSTPPEITCTRQTCPPFPKMDDALCTESIVPGQCCPSISCVSANPPVIDVCQDVVCKAGEQCQRQSQESPDGSWMAPIGKCVPNTKI